jgi:hypothetical protein
MKKQASDQQFHDRRYQERKRAAAARQPANKKKTAGADLKANIASPVKDATKE